MSNPERYNQANTDSSSYSVTLRAERVVEEARRLAEKWRNDTTCYSDDYYAGQQAGRNQCATELDALLASQEAAPPAQSEEK